MFVLLEHPEALGRVHPGEPASIWQLEDVRSAFGNAVFASVVGHQCQHPEVDYAKLTRLYGNLKALDQFGYPGWPVFDAAGYYQGPLPRSFGHNHRRKLSGRNKDGGHNIVPTAAYCASMFLFMASLIFENRANQKGVRSARM